MEGNDLKDIFDFTHAGYSKPNMQELKPWYTKVLLGKKKVEHHIVLMKCEDFFKHSFARTDIKNEPLRRKRSPKDFTKFALPYIDLLQKKGLGRGRVLVCYNSGIKEVPVLIVGDMKKWLKETGIKVAEM